MMVMMIESTRARDAYRNAMSRIVELQAHYLTNVFAFPIAPDLLHDRPGVIAYHATA